MTPSGRPRVRIVPDSRELARVAAQTFVNHAQAAIAAQGRFAAALSGGSTPRATYALLAEPEFAECIDWPRVKLFQVDERLVPPDHPDSNVRMIRSALAARVSLPPDGLEPLVRAGDDAEAIAADAERRIRGWFQVQAPAVPRFDLVLLGLGSDGHTASLFPGTRALDERTKLTAAVPLAPAGIDRITLTLPVLNHAAAVVFLVSGREKARVLRRVLGDTAAAPPLPAELVKPPSAPMWIVDAEAASEL